MIKPGANQEETDGLTQKDVDEAIERLHSFYTSLTKQNVNDELPPRKIIDDGKHITIRLKQDPYSSIDQMREGKPIKVKTIFHAVEVRIEDEHGGDFTCEYHIRETVNKIIDCLIPLYPKYSKAHLEKIAKSTEKDYEEVKTAVADSIAQKVFEIRIAIAKFFHEQLEPTLKIVLEDLIVDAGLCGLEKYGYQLSHASDFEKFQGKYSKLRKKRIEIIKGKGRPKGASFLDKESLEKMIERIFGFISELKSKNQTVTKHAVARKLYPQNSNPLQQFDRFMKRYQITFQQIIDEHKNRKI